MRQKLVYPFETKGSGTIKQFYYFESAAVSSICVTSGLNPSCKKNSAAPSRHSHITGCSSSSYPFLNISTALLSQSFFLVVSDLARQSTASAMLSRTASSSLSQLHKTARILFSASSSSAISSAVPSKSQEKQQFLIAPAHPSLRKEFFDSSWDASACKVPLPG